MKRRVKGIICIVVFGIILTMFSCYARIDSNTVMCDEEYIDNDNEIKEKNNITNEEELSQMENKIEASNSENELVTKEHVQPENKELFSDYKQTFETAKPVQIENETVPLIDGKDLETEKTTQTESKIQLTSSEKETVTEKQLQSENLTEVFDDEEDVEQEHVHVWHDTANYHFIECRSHGYNGEGEMFFESLEDLYLHQKADGCMSSWGTGFKGVATRTCYSCRTTEMVGHVHDFGTIEKKVHFETIKCECGARFNGGKDKKETYYTALESWQAHQNVYVSYGKAYSEHDAYMETTDSWAMYYEATESCSCGWLPVDKYLLNERDLVKNGAVIVSDVIINGVGGNEL